MQSLRKRNLPKKKKPEEKKPKVKPVKTVRAVKKPAEAGLAAEAEPVPRVKHPVQPTVQPEKIKEPIKSIEEKIQPKEIKLPEEKPLPVEEELPAETAVPLPEEEVVQKVPDRFKKELETEKEEKFKAKPQMQRAFQAIRKIETKKWHDPKQFKRTGKDRFIQREEQRPQLQPGIARKKH